MRYEQDSIPSSPCPSADYHGHFVNSVVLMCLSQRSKKKKRLHMWRSYLPVSSSVSWRQSPNCWGDFLSNFIRETITKTFLVVIVSAVVKFTFLSAINAILIYVVSLD
jgi:hypothetical protein